MRVLLTLALAAVPAVSLAQSHVAPTDAKTPADELKSFKLPPGFAAQLVAAEPDIAKPIQIAFDARGRLWATTSRHYPFPAPAGEKPSDKLFVLADFGPDGKAGKVTVFADDLNIPIGILPLPDCKSCLVSEVGRILKLSDTDGDGKADRREVILSGFGTDDTHGMTNSLTLLPDGWVYATHGFRNSSSVTAKDGSTVKMQSGNTYRFRPDGSRVEPWTYGQVNPFGMTVDPWLNLYTADCHSKPITQLIRGAYYDSFGKPHDGLGFAPHVTRHDHGSTALCGLAWYEADHFPKAWTGCMFLGNVVTNRINADRIEWKGATPVAKELPDFLTSSDPWFRPTDIKLGPDGALYFADFYNKIIGHYEVDLKHPGRDKDRGRIWRVVYKAEGGRGKAEGPTMPDLTPTDPRQPRTDRPQADPSNLAVRLLTMTQVVEAYARTAEIMRRLEATKGPTQGRIPIEQPKGSDDKRVLTAWFDVRVGGPDLTPEFTAKLVSGGGEPLDKANRIKAVASLKEWTDPVRAAVLARLADPSPHVARAAAEALIVHRHPDNVAPLVKLIAACPAEDVTLRHTARIALRNALRDANGWDAAAKAATTPAETAVVTDVALGVPSKQAAGFLLGQVQRGAAGSKACEHVGRYGDDAQAAALAATLRTYADPRAAMKAVAALARGVAARGAKLPMDALNTAINACDAGLQSKDAGFSQDAAELAGSLKLGTLFDDLEAFAVRADQPDAPRVAAILALLNIEPTKAAPVVGVVMTSPTIASPGLREKAAAALGSANRQETRVVLVAALANAPARLAAGIAAALAGSSEGAAALLDAVGTGKASPLLLQDKAVATKLGAIDGGKLKPRIAELTKGLPSPDARLAAVLKQRVDGFARAKASADAGKQVFARNCAACHQIKGEGAKVGPQLDGIGNRGADRVLEDVLDPNRNVDHAFRATVLNLSDGRTVSGLLVREEGQTLVVADAAGKEVRVPAADVDKRTVTPLSPMPSNFDTAIPEAEFYQLVAYLLDQRAK